MLPWKLRKRQVLPDNQNLSSIYFSLAKFQLVSCNLSLAMIWQMTYSDTAKTVFNIFYVMPETLSVLSLTLKPFFLPCSFWPPKGFSASGRTVTVSRFTAFSGSREAICS